MCCHSQHVAAPVITSCSSLSRPAEICNLHPALRVFFSSSFFFLLVFLTQRLQTGLFHQKWRLIRYHRQWAVCLSQLSVSYLGGLWKFLRQSVRWRCDSLFLCDCNILKIQILFNFFFHFLKLLKNLEKSQLLKWLRAIFPPVEPKSSAEHCMKTKYRSLAAPPPQTPLLSIAPPLPYEAAF